MGDGDLQNHPHSFFYGVEFFFLTIQFGINWVLQNLLLQEDMQKEHLAVSDLGATWDYLGWKDQG